MNHAIKLCCLIVVATIFSNCGVMVRNFVGESTDKSYVFKNKTKRELYNAIKCSYSSNPESYPRNDNDFMNKKKSASNTSENNLKTSADSAKFYFEMRPNDSTRVIYWTKLNKLQENWDSKTDINGFPTKLIFHGLWINQNLFYISKTKEKRKNEKEIERYIRQFEQKLLPEIQKCAK